MAQEMNIAFTRLRPVVLKTYNSNRYLKYIIHFYLIADEALKPG